MDFTIKTYGLQELALFYFPNSTPSSASCQLKKWINRSESLLIKLKERGYMASSCRFSHPLNLLPSSLNGYSERFSGFVKNIKLIAYLAENPHKK